MKEAMEKKAEEHALEFVPPEEKWKEHHENEFNKRRSSFIAGWQEQDKEIERLKGLLRKEFEKSFRFPKRVNVNAEWEHYSNSNNL